MKKIIVLAILGFSLLSIISINAYAETLYVDANVGDMKKIDESKYKVSGVTILRNEYGELVSVVRVDVTRYLDDPIIDQFLKSDPKYLVKQGIVNNEKISLYRIQVEYSNEKCATETLQVRVFNDECNLYNRSFVTMLGITDSKGEQYFAFKGLNHVYTLKPSDKIITIWNILTKD
jgi:hypothetical protein